MPTMLKHIFWPILFHLVPACMPPELQAVKVLFYAKSVGVVTSGHVTKMAVKPFDPPFPKTPFCTQTARLYLL